MSNQPILYAGHRDGCGYRPPNSSHGPPEGAPCSCFELSGGRITDPNLRRAIYHLLWVWCQYPHDTRTEPIVGAPATAVRLPHRNMRAGEDATDWLISFGLATDQGYHCELTAHGLEIFNDESLCEMEG